VFISFIPCLIWLSQTIDYLKTKPEIIPNFLKHTENQSVLNLFLRIIATEESTDPYQDARSTGTIQWLCSTDLVATLVEKFEPSLGAVVHENASQALDDIIYVANKTSPNSSPLIAQIESDKFISVLLKNISSQGLSSSLQHGLVPIISLLRIHASTPHDYQTPLDQLPLFLKHMITIIPKFAEILASTEKIESNSNSFKLLPNLNQTQKPLGFCKLKLIEFFTTLVFANYKEIEMELMKSSALPCCVELFFQYPWNNFLHAVVEQMVTAILEGENLDFKMWTLKDAKVVDRIVESSNANEDRKSKPNGIGLGYMGHITMMTTSIINVSGTMPAVDDWLAGLEHWQKYSAGIYATTIARQIQPYTGQEVPEDTFASIQQNEYPEQGEGDNSPNYSYFPSSSEPQEFDNDNEEFQNAEGNFANFTDTNLEGSESNTGGEGENNTQIQLSEIDQSLQEL